MPPTPASPCPSPPALQSVPYAEPVQRYLGLGAVSAAATPIAFAQLPKNRAAKKLLLKVG